MQFFQDQKDQDNEERFSMTAAHIYFITGILLMTGSYNCMYWRYCNS